MVISLNMLLTLCGSFSCVCLAGGYLYKIIKAVKKPAEDIEEKFETYDKKFNFYDKEIKNLNEIAKSNTECLELLLSSTLAILGHLELGNHSNEMKQERQKIQAFLTSRVNN